MPRLTDGVSAVYHRLATSDDALSRTLRHVKRTVENFELPVPPSVARPMRLGYDATRWASEFGQRVFLCQPIFRAYCKECGPNLRTGSFIHYVQGQGDIIVGSNVWLDGKITFTFAATFAERPTLIIGDGSAIGHQTEITVGKRVTIGSNCLLSGAITIFDSNGHPSDPVERRMKKPPPAHEVRPVHIGDDVWIGKRCIIFPGVRIGDCAIVSSGTVVRRHVPAYGVVAGNPAQLVFRLPRPVASNQEKAEIAERAARAV